MPITPKVPGERLVGKACPYQFDWQTTTQNDGIMKFCGIHFTGFDEFFIECAKLERTDHIAYLIKRWVSRGHCAAAHLCLGVSKFKTSFFHQKIDGLFSRPVPKLIVERKDDAVSAMQAPKEHADFIRVTSWKSP